MRMNSMSVNRGEPSAYSSRTRARARVTGQIEPRFTRVHRRSWARLLRRRTPKQFRDRMKVLFRCGRRSPRNLRILGPLKFRLPFRWRG